jgi:hypothetical protein
MGSLVDSGTALLAAAAEGEIASTTNGSAWSWIGAVNQLHVVALATDAPMLTGVTEEAAAPKFVARTPFPNPGTSSAGAVFSFSLPSPERVRVSLYDAQGRRIAWSPERTFQAGEQNTFRWAVPSLAAGTYLVHFETASGLSARSKWTVIR